MRTQRLERVAWWIAIVIALAALTRPVYGAGGEPAPMVQGRSLGPDVVILDELVDLFQPVPFDHRGHAEMADMWDGCVTCHHHTPAPSGKPVNGDHHTQDEAAEIPACKSCHAVSDKTATIQMPSLKGAYHRQCLNCHRDWAGENQCGACHEPRKPGAPVVATPSPDDILGRMHPPIPAPKEKLYRARFTPAVGSNVLFRHDAHVEKYDIRCVSCHQRENCSQCHSANGAGTVQPIKRGRTWDDSHKPCSSCHTREPCGQCHYHDDQSPPPPFDHQQLAQRLDDDHVGLACSDCHASWVRPRPIGCGDSSCHAEAKTTVVSYPEHRPGEWIEPPAVQPPRDAPIRLIRESERRRLRERRGPG